MGRLESLGAIAHAQLPYVESLLNHCILHLGQKARESVKPIWRLSLDGRHFPVAEESQKLCRPLVLIRGGRLLPK